MKKLLALLMTAILILSALPLAAAEGEYYSFRLFEIVQDGIVYRAYGNNSVTFQLYKDGTMKVYGLRFPDEEADPSDCWALSEDRKAILMTFAGQDYTLAFENNIMTLPFDGRDVVLRQKHEADEEAEKPAENQTIASTELSGWVEKVCPIEFTRWKDIAVCYQMDGNARYRFNSDYGVFLYVIDTVSGDIIAKEEPDIEAARSREGFREELSSDEIYDIVFGLCPVQRSAADKISRSYSPDGSWEITIATVYGDFFYKVDAYSGEVLDKIEPDVDMIREQEGFREPITSEQALEIAEKACPLDFGAITGRKVSQSEAGFTVTLSSSSGSYVYTINKLTGEIVEKTEPEAGEAPAQTDSHALTDAGEGLMVAEKAFPLGPDKITSRKVNRGTGEIWTITLGTVYGDFVYLIDPATGEIVDRNEPDIEEARNQEGFREPLSNNEIMDIAVQASGLKPGEILSRHLSHGEDNLWKITLGTAQGDYYFEIDGFSGEVLDSAVPGGTAPVKEKDPFEAAIDAAFASMDGFDYKAENIRVSQSRMDGKDVIKVTFTWRGDTYEKIYSIADKRLISAE